MIIDLSVVLNEDTPVYPGDPKTKIMSAAVIEKEGYIDHKIELGTHVGIHIDAPAHMIDRGKSLGQFSVEHFVGRGRLIDVRNGYELSDFVSAGIELGDIVLLRTGFADKFRDDDTYFTQYSAIPDEIADFLVRKKPKMVGMDMCSPDYEPFAVHKKLLSANILIIENMTNLEALEGEEFKVYALPLKLQIDGSPARVVAELK